MAATPAQALAAATSLNSMCIAVAAGTSRLGIRLSLELGNSAQLPVRAPGRAGLGARRAGCPLAGHWPKGASGKWAGSPDGLGGVLIHYNVYVGDIASAGGARALPMSPPPPRLPDVPPRPSLSEPAPTPCRDPIRTATTSSSTVFSGSCSGAARNARGTSAYDLITQTPKMIKLRKLCGRHDFVGMSETHGSDGGGGSIHAGALGVRLLVAPLPPSGLGGPLRATGFSSTISGGRPSGLGGRPARPGCCAPPTGARGGSHTHDRFPDGERAGGGKTGADGRDTPMAPTTRELISRDGRVLH